MAQAAEQTGRTQDRSGSMYTRLTLALVALVSLVSVTVNLANYFVFSWEAEQNYRARSEEYTVYLRESLEWPLWNIDDELIARIGSAFVSNAEIATLVIRDDQQRVLYRKEESAVHQVRQTVPILHGGQEIGSVEIGLSLGGYEERNRQLLIASVLTMLLLVGVLLGATRWIMSRMLQKPVESVIAAIRDMGEGRYEQVALPDTYREFTPILDGFKAMTEAVASRENRLRESNAKLAAEIVERNRAQDALRVSEARFRKLVKVLSIPLCYVSRGGVIEEFNDRFAQVFGYGREEIRTLDDWWRLVCPNEAYREWAISTWNEAVQQAAATGQDIRPVEYRVTCKNGDSRVMEISGVVLGEDFLATFVDLTTRLQAEEELRRYKDHLEEEVQLRTADLVLARNAADAANKAKSVFLANMSHELRTPLNAILGFSNIMRKDPALQHEQRSNLEIINRSGEHLLTLINDVLEMSKIEAGRVQVENAAFDLGGLVRDVSDMMHVRAQEKGLQLLVEQSSEVPRYIRSDEARLRQVLINLVGNAVKFTQQGGITVRFGVKPDAERERLLIEVEDTGVGIRPEDQQRRFEPFVQLGEDASQKGTGLGLTLTRQYIELMGGQISVDSTPGQGSVFHVLLPLEKVEATEVSQQQSTLSREVTGLAPGQPEYRILIVEDQLENQLLLSKLMQNISMQVKVAENGEQAVALFQSWQPHLIWMDRRMPVMDGIEATRKIRTLPGGKDVKIIAVTASAFTEQRDEMLSSGMDDFVRKPYRFNEIYECLGRQLGVKYSYADAEPEPGMEPALTSEMLSVLPEEARKELREALESLEDARIQRALQAVAACDAVLHRTLSHLVENYDYPSILKAL